MHSNFTRETPDIETSSESYAQRFSGRAGAYFLDVQRRSLLAALQVPAGKSVLDVGGGHGQLIPTLIERDFKVTVIGSSDICRERLDNYLQNDEIDFVAGDFLNLPFRDNSYDTVVSVRLISHIVNWQRLISEFCRVARNSVILDYPSNISLNALTPILFKLKKKLEGNTRTYRSFREKELGFEFDKHGFEVTDRQKQFFLPMVVHRVLNGAMPLQILEKMARHLMITAMFGTPVVLRLDKRSNNTRR